MRQPGVEPGSPAWKAGILTVGLLTRSPSLGVPRDIDWQMKTFLKVQLNNKETESLHEAFRVLTVPTRLLSRPVGLRSARLDKRVGPFAFSYV